MKIVKPEAAIISDLPEGFDAARFIERIGRTCYKSEDKISPDTAVGFVKHLISCGHESMLEHLSVTVKFICSRGVANEIVRHRIASFAQESTRYCNYGSDRFGNEIVVIWPVHLFEDPGNTPDDYLRIISSNEDANEWYKGMMSCEAKYMNLIKNGVHPEIARDVLPLGLKTELIMTANIREWRHFFKLRLFGKSGNPHPEIKYLANMIFDDFKWFYQPMFKDIDGLRTERKVNNNG